MGRHETRRRRLLVVPAVPPAGARGRAATWPCRPDVAARPCEIPGRAASVDWRQGAEWRVEESTRQASPPNRVASVRGADSGASTVTKPREHPRPVPGLRLRRALGLLLLAGLIGLSNQPGRAQPLKKDPVEEFRQALILEKPGV